MKVVETEAFCRWQITFDWMRWSILNQCEIWGWMRYGRCDGFWKRSPAIVASHRSVLDCTTSRMLSPIGDFDPHRRQRCSFHARYPRQLVTEVSHLPVHALGTIYQPVSLQRPLCLLSERDTKPNFFSPCFALTVHMRMHVLIYMPLICVYFLFKRMCGPPYCAYVVPLQLNLAPYTARTYVQTVRLLMTTNYWPTGSTLQNCTGLTVVS